MMCYNRYKLRAAARRRRLSTRVHQPLGGAAVGIDTGQIFPRRLRPVESSKSLLPAPSP